MRRLPRYRASTASPQACEPAQLFYGTARRAVLELEVLANSGSIAGLEAQLGRTEEQEV